jgi:putative PIN family toxin of toxin-antitoxin system
VIRLVVDPGVFVSALIGRSGSPPDLILQAWIEDRIEVVASPALLTELRLVLMRPKFRRWFDETAARHLVERIERHATVLPDADPPAAVTRDPADDYLVALARVAGAAAIVSGDRDLLDVELADPPAWTPRACADRLAETS